MNSLPIRLHLLQVDLVGPHDDETAPRWTLGPTWYPDHQYDEDLLPYFEDGDRTTEESADAPDKVKTWAAQMITRTTDYRVTGWTGLVPDLEIEQHGLEIWTTAGVRASYRVTGSAAQTVYASLGNSGTYLTLPRPDGSTSRIPVRAITTVNSTVHRIPVQNRAGYRPPDGNR